MILKSAVRAFLSKPRDDLRKYKELTDGQLRRMRRGFPVKPPIWKKLNRDQRILFVVAVKFRKIACWADTGIGKTLLSMSLARYFRRAGVARRFLVLVPNKINLAEWEAERDKHCPKTSMVILTGSSRDKWEAVDSGAPLLTVATYGGLVRMVSGKVQVKKGRREGKTILAVNPRRLAKLASTFDGLIMDESSADQAVQYKSSLAFRVCRQFAKRGKVGLALSGTPFGRDPTPLWAQMFLVDGGDSIGANLGMFRAAFFTEAENPWGGTEYTFDDKKSPLLRRCLAHRSISIEADESSLPPVVADTKVITLPHEAGEYCRLAREAITAARGNYVETKNAFLRMRQISSGFLGYTDDQTGARAKFMFDENPKLDALISRVQSVCGKYKVVIFHEFIYSGDQIAAALSRMKIGWARIGSGAARDAKIERGRFAGDAQCRVLIISNRNAMGPNLQVAKYLEFYESPVSPKTRKQARRRVERQHSEHDRVFITDYVVAGTYDQRILEFHEEGRDLFDALIKGEAVS